MQSHPRLTAPMSPSALETFADCPMRFFLSRVLGLGDLEEPEQIAQITPLERGLADAHGAGAGDEGVAARRPARRAARRDAHLAQLDQVAREECAAAQARGITGYPALWEAERDGILLDLRLWYEAEVKHDELDSGPRFDAADFEVGFGLDAQPERGPALHTGAAGAGGGSAPAALPRAHRPPGVDRGGSRLSGDRLQDRQQAQRKPVTSSPAGRALQLPLYLHAAADVILGRDWRAGSAEYFFSTRKGSFARVRDERRQAGRAPRGVRAHRRRLLAGDRRRHLPRPARGARVRLLRLPLAVPGGSDHEAQVERKVGDPRVAAAAASWRRSSERGAAGRRRRPLAHRDRPALQPVRRSRRGHRQDDRAGAPGRGAAARAARPRWTSWRSSPSPRRQPASCRLGCASRWSGQLDATGLGERRARARGDSAGRPLPRAHPDHPRLRVRPAARAPGRGAARPPVRDDGRRHRRRALRAGLPPLAGRAAGHAQPSDRACAAARLRPGSPARAGGGGAPPPRGAAAGAAGHPPARRRGIPGRSRAGGRRAWTELEPRCTEPRPTARSSCWDRCASSATRS